MLILILVLTIINTIGLTSILVQKFNDTFCIVKKELYDTLLDYWAEYHDEEGNELRHELAGGTGTPYYGFFQDYLEEDPGEEEEEDE